MSSPQRLYELDVLRGFAALGVVLFHFTTDLSKPIGHVDSLFHQFHDGYYSVELFFIISGFVIFMTLERIERGMDFIISRLSRLYPIYWFSVIFLGLFLLWEFGEKSGVSFGKVLVNLTMLQTFVSVSHIEPLYWTLTQELCFYGWMFLLYQTNQLKNIHFFAFASLIAMVIFSILEQNNILVLPGRLKILLLLDHGMFFVAGIAFYQLYKKATGIQWHLLVAASLATYLVHKSHGYWIVIGFLVCFYLMIKGYLEWLNSRQEFIFLGTISYSLYLFHNVIGEFVIRQLFHQFNVNANLCVFIAVCCVITLASFLTFYIEQPGSRYMRNTLKHWLPLAVSRFQ